MSEEDLIDLAEASGAIVYVEGLDVVVIEFDLESFGRFVEEIRMCEATTLGHL